VIAPTAEAPGSAMTHASTSPGCTKRVALVGFDDRKLLLGHKSDHVTTHYSAPAPGDRQNDHDRCQVIDLEMEREGLELFGTLS